MTRNKAVELVKSGQTDSWLMTMVEPVVPLTEKEKVRRALTEVLDALVEAK